MCALLNHFPFDQIRKSGHFWRGRWGCVCGHWCYAQSERRGAKRKFSKQNNSLVFRALKNSDAHSPKALAQQRPRRDTLDGASWPCRSMPPG
jgi:hypothetical protein